MAKLTVKGNQSLVDAAVQEKTLILADALARGRAVTMIALELMEAAETIARTQKLSKSIGEAMASAVNMITSALSCATSLIATSAGAEVTIRELTEGRDEILTSAKMVVALATENGSETSK